MNKLYLILCAIILISCSGSPRFRLMDPERTGIEFQNTVTASDSMNLMNYEYFYNGAGVGAGDLNNDGLTDLIFAGNQVCSKIYLNSGLLRFRDITSNFKGLTNDQWYSGVALADVNNDGWLDVYLTSTAGKDRKNRKNRLWINGGSVNGQDPVFTEKAEEYGIACDDQSVAAAFFDYDLDGYLDLYVLNNEIRYPAVSIYRPRITDGTSPNNDRLYHNNGNGTFTDVTKQAGILIEGFGMGLAISDINKDGYPDIYISNDLLSNDVLYINQGNGTFRNEISKYISYQSRTSKGNDIADVNNDGNPDIFTLDMMPSSYQKKKQTINGFNYKLYEADEQFGFEHQYQRNMLHLNNGLSDGNLLSFSEAGQIMGLSETDWSWSPLFGDVDNDGSKDLLITTGFPRDIRDKDWTKIKASAAGSLTTEKALSEMAPELKITNIAFRNNGDSVFCQKNDWLPEIPSFSYGATLADLDNDGDLDYIVNNINDKAFILKNTTVEKSGNNSHYISVRLKGTTFNPMAIGAKIETWCKGKRQFCEQFLTRGYASSIDPVIHFGLAGNNVIDSIKIIWPGNSYVSLLENIKSNQILEISQENTARLKRDSVVSAKSESLFYSNDSILDYTHLQNDFNDFLLGQKIIPHKFSQTGPVIEKGDINGDGLEDLIIGATNKQPAMVYLRRGAGFQRAEIPGLTTSKGVTESGIAVTDYDNDGDNDIVVLAGGYENEREEDYQHFIYENNKGVFTPHPLNLPKFPGSVVRTCDFDHNGYVDLFIGSRVKKGIYPYANHSWILKNKNGVFSAENEFRLNLGMVTDAVWADYDKDGWEDLIVVREWNSPVILRNNQGKELVPVFLGEVESMHGLWTSIAAGDFDGDGDPDYVLGNLGENHRFIVNNKYPLHMYAADLEQDGIIDPIMTAFWKNSKGVMTEYPVNYLDELESQSPMIKAFCRDYTSFSSMSFADLLPEKFSKRIELSLYVNTTSSYILWNDQKSFRWERLPFKTQLSPLTDLIVTDLNHDGLPDLLAAGNDYTWDIATGYFDANKGLVLINKGRKPIKNTGPTFEILEPEKSGFLVSGMMGSLIRLEGDTDIVIAGINRRKAIVFNHPGR
ncbi:MAG: VCBS repeat-containing protein [Bacteroidales bacterium]|nr:VCBS repeat-containing protein [Bacteroidales bacterium]